MTTTEAADQLLADGLRAWLLSRGLDPNSSGLRDTPDRAARALADLTAGYADDPARHLARVFPVERGDGLIALTDVPFTSVCEHHLLPFSGTATIAYLPGTGAPVAGLSKLARVLDVYARRLQVQERRAIVKSCG